MLNTLPLTASNVWSAGVCCGRMLRSNWRNVDFGWVAAWKHAGDSSATPYGVQEPAALICAITEHAPRMPYYFGWLRRSNSSSGCNLVHPDLRLADCPSHRCRYTQKRTRPLAITRRNCAAQKRQDVDQLGSRFHRPLTDRLGS
jgi:hypothetical protein